MTLYKTAYTAHVEIYPSVRLVVCLSYSILFYSFYILSIYLSIYNYVSTYPVPMDNTESKSIKIHRFEIWPNPWTILNVALTNFAHLFWIFGYWLILCYFCELNSTVPQSNVKYHITLWNYFKIVHQKSSQNSSEMSRF